MTILFSIHFRFFIIGLSKVGTKKEIDGYEDDSDNEVDNTVNETVNDIEDDSDDDNNKSNITMKTIDNDSDDDEDMPNSKNMDVLQKLNANLTTSSNVKKVKNRVSFGTDVSMHSNVKKNNSKTVSAAGGDVESNEGQGLYFLLFFDLFEMSLYNYELLFNYFIFYIHVNDCAK